MTTRSEGRALGVRADRLSAALEVCAMLSAYDDETSQHCVVSVEIADGILRFHGTQGHHLARASLLVDNDGERERCAIRAPDALSIAGMLQDCDAAALVQLHVTEGQLAVIGERWHVGVNVIKEGQLGCKLPPYEKVIPDIGSPSTLSDGFAVDMALLGKVLRYGATFAKRINMLHPANVYTPEHPTQPITIAYDAAECELLLLLMPMRPNSGAFRTCAFKPPPGEHPWKGYDRARFAEREARKRGET